MQRKLLIWAVTDNKPGHRIQLAGLVEALAKRREISVSWIDCSKGSRTPAPGYESPELILAAGHSTHCRARWLRLRYGGKLVVLMKPSLPGWLFDLCVIPEHDRGTPSPRLVHTRGTLNDLTPANEQDPDRGLILIGGISRRHQWSDELVINQLQDLTRRLPDRHWTLTTSRRTPASFLGALSKLNGHNFQVAPYADTDRQWLLQQYRDCGTIWVTEDSVSMVYESLTAGASVGVLHVPRRRKGRVSAGLDKLIKERAVAVLEQIDPGGGMPAPRPPLDEARRVAELLDGWLAGGTLQRLSI